MSCSVFALNISLAVRFGWNGAKATSRNNNICENYFEQMPCPSENFLNDIESRSRAKQAKANERINHEKDKTTPKSFKSFSIFDIRFCIFCLHRNKTDFEYKSVSWL